MSTSSHQTDKTDQIDQKTVLVAVTDIFFYTKVRDALLSKGYRLEKARLQQDIADKASSSSPSLVILNMNDQALDAFQALETLKSVPQLKAIPTLAFANHEEADTWNRAKALGVTKIVSRNEFSARTKDLVEEVIAIGNQPSAISK
ncbi:MAG TPA: histidine kinase [Nitrospiraceae bacterium]|nr:histidine kinase [Nitrospiraceae bacterium]